jgi:hypothetical protein
VFSRIKGAAGGRQQRRCCRTGLREAGDARRQEYLTADVVFILHL